MFDRWATDILPLAGEYFRTITKDLMWDNKLYNDTMTVGGRARMRSPSTTISCPMMPPSI
jgi:poly(3-hydroxyalkanoate) synthetase